MEGPNSVQQQIIEKLDENTWLVMRKIKCPFQYVKLPPSVSEPGFLQNEQDLWVKLKIISLQYFQEISNHLGVDMINEHF